MPHRLVYDRDRRLRICGRYIGDMPEDVMLRGSHRVCYGQPGHSGMHGMEGGLTEWLMSDGEYEKFRQGEHEKLAD